MRSLTLLGALLVTPGLLAAEPPSFSDKVAPLLTKYCAGCHGDKKPKADVVLHNFQDEAAALKNPKLWERVLRNLQSGDMPPEGKPRPTPAEKDLVRAWIEAKVYAVNCEVRTDPGRVTVRRLNRVEYNNTIRDLVGVDFKPAEDFPADDVGYGFDNIGDVLSMPPLLLEKYLAAAEKVMAQALAVEDRNKAPGKRLAAKDLEATSSGLIKNDARVLNTAGDVFIHHTFPRDGVYLFQIRASAQQAGPEVARLTLTLDRQPVQTVDVTGPEVLRNYFVRAEVPAGTRRLAVAFANPYQAPREPGRRREERHVTLETLEIVGPVPQPSPDLPDSHRKLLRCPPGKPEEQARHILADFARRAYRRPVNADEVNRLVRLTRSAWDQGESFERGLQLAMQAVLVSPHFLFRVEQDPKGVAPESVYSITEYELASRLSYFLWSSMPDEELFDLAGKGQLRPNLEAQVRRMLRDSRSRALVENFAGQWLQLRNLRTVAPDTGRFPTFTEALRLDMQRETELFFEAVLREDRSILEFLDADYTFLNDRLARHYGVANVRGSYFRRVELAGIPRGGVLTQASVLTVTSNPTRTSPVKRGKWILENILGTPPPPPPPDVPELEQQKALSGSLRQRMEQHRVNPNCAVCHNQMDALGFSFENFDAVGAWRTHDDKFLIDPSGELPGGRTFKGPQELKKILLGQKELFSRCLAEKMLTYALGRGLEYYDKCALDAITTGLAKHDHRMSRLILEIVQSEPFQKRRAKKGG